MKRRPTAKADPDRIADALARIGDALRVHEQRASQDEGLSPLQSRILVVLQREGALRIGELADRLLVSYGTVSTAVDALEAKQCVARSSDPEEHRAVIVEATEPGEQASNRVADWPGQALAPAISRLATADRAALLRPLLEVIRILERQGLVSTTRMCVSCKYFRPGEGTSAAPHYCALLESPIGAAELRVHCPDHQPAEPRGR